MLYNKINYFFIQKPNSNIKKKKVWCNSFSSKKNKSRVLCTCKYERDWNSVHNFSFFKAVTVGDRKNINSKFSSTERRVG
jgi:hypothetical protein